MRYDFRCPDAPDWTLRQAIDRYPIWPWHSVTAVHLKWLDDRTLEYAVARRTPYQTTAAHSASCGLKVWLPLDQAMAWTRVRRMGAAKRWVTTQPDKKDSYNLVCSHQIAFKNPDHAFEFKMRWL